jgi:lipid II:glycine glycyltransferase (peptidoglycan interpeptide bridge formation enzyme)
MQFVVHPGKALAWVYEEDENCILIPLISRNIENDNTLYDLSSPYGYSGILYPENTPQKIVFKALEVFHKEAFKAGYISSFIRLHPIYNNFYYSDKTYLKQIAHGSTISIDLSQSFSEIQNSFSLNHRRNLKRLNQKKFKTEINNWADFPAFISLYTETMQLKKADKRYFFSNAYFQELKNMLGTSMFLISVSNEKGEMASAGLFTLFHSLAQYHLGATANKDVSLSPSKLMMEAAIIEMKKQGARILHLGGGYGACNKDGLYRFKKGFGHTLHTFSTLRMIHHPDKYQELVASRKGFAVNSTDFFPEYRKPSISETKISKT